MVTKYDVFYVIASKGEIKVNDILEELKKPKEEYQNVFNNVIELEKEGYVKRETNIKIIHKKKTEELFRLISFCINNSINYNLLLKKSMLKFIQKAAKKEFFTNEDVGIHPQTYKLYTDALSKYGFLLIISKKPLRCKLLRHYLFFDLMKFAKLKLDFYKPKQKSFIPEIKKEMIKFRRYKKIDPIIQKDDEAKFIYTSLHLEGNPITLPDTQKIIIEDIVPRNYKLEHIEEISNYKKAVELMLIKAGQKVKLDLNLILEYHRIALSSIKEAGIIRKQNVIIKKNPNFKTSDWKEIPIKIDTLLEMYNNFESKDVEGMIHLASFFHNEFQRIHPFIDGNSRTSRLLMLHILRYYELPVLDLPIGYFDLYLDLTKRSTKRDDMAFQYLIEEIILMNLKKKNQ